MIKSITVIIALKLIFTLFDDLEISGLILHIFFGISQAYELPG
jgi:hypothetical protein